MYTKKMYVDDRTWVLYKIKVFRSIINEYALDGYDYLLDDYIKLLQKRIKTYQEMLVIMRNRYYSPDYQERSTDNNRPFNWR